MGEIATGLMMVAAALWGGSGRRGSVGFSHPDGRGPLDDVAASTGRALDALAADSRGEPASRTHAIQILMLQIAAQDEGGQ